MATETVAIRKKGDVSPALAAGLICLVIGGALGYYANYFLAPQTPPPAPAASRGGMGGMGGGPPGGMGGMGGGGMGGPPSGGMALARMVRNLDTIQKVQGAALTPAQSKEVLTILNQIKAAEKLPTAEAEKQTAALEKLLTPAQKEALSALQPAGGRGGGMGGGMMGGGGMGGGGYGGGGGRPDPDKPFASERNKAALDSLIEQVSKGG